MRRRARIRTRMRIRPRTRPRKDQDHDKDMDNKLHKSSKEIFIEARTRYSFIELWE